MRIRATRRSPVEAPFNTVFARKKKAAEKGGHETLSGGYDEEPNTCYLPMGSGQPSNIQFCELFLSCLRRTMAAC